MAIETAPKPPAAQTDEMPLLGIDHVELYVGNATQAAYWFKHALGFRETAYAGLETGVRDRSSHVLEQGRVRFVLTAPLLGTSEIARHVAAHGDGVRVIALSVPRRRACLPLRRPARRPRRARALGGVRRRRHGADGDDRHLRRDRCTRSSSATATSSGFLPGFEARDDGSEAGLFAGVDHVVGNVELGRLDEWVGYYERVFGMTEMIHFSDEDIGTEYSALMSKVMADGKGRVKFPINEPAEGQRKSQIEEYLEYYGGPGAQHIALATTDIVATVARAARARGALPGDARQLLRASSPGGSARSTRTSPTCAELGILADRDDEGYLLQIFTETIGDRPTVFLEVIERHGARGFGEGTSRPCSKRSSASRRGEETCEVSPARRDPRQAPHPVPRRQRQRRQRRRPPAGRGGDGLRGLLRQRVDPLPRRVAVPDRRRGRVHPDRAHRVGPRRPRPPPPVDRLGRARRRPGRTAGAA